MGELIRQTDWTKTQLGDPASWSDSLKFSISFCLNSNMPMAFYWGTDFTLFYNDAWISILGNKHPWALGKPAAEVWREIWAQFSEELNNVMLNAESLRFENAKFILFRYGYLEECYFDYTLSPVFSAEGNAVGVCSTVFETTYRVLNERRNSILYNLLKLQTEQNYMSGIDHEMIVLNDAKQDLPFSLLYKANLKNEHEPILIAASGITKTEATELNTLVTQAFETGKPLHINNLSAYIPDEVACGELEICTEAFIVPLTVADTAIKICLVAGISSRKKLDADYIRFIESVAHSMGTAIARDYSYNQEQKSRQRLLESEDRFRSMIDQAPVAMAVFRGENLLLSKANKAMLRMMKRNEEIIGKKLLVIFPELVDQPIAKILQEVFKTGKPYLNYDMVVPLLRKGKTEPAYFDFSYSPLIEEGQITGVLAVAAEVTERFKAQEKLQKSEALFRGITAASPTALWITDETGDVTYVNNTWLTWAGKPLEKHLGKGWLDTVTADDRMQAYDKFIADFSARRYYENTFNILTTNGQELSLSCTGNPIFDDNHKFKGYVGACVDITEQKQLQRQKDNFLGIASHELKTPVTSIKAYAQVLEMMFRRDGDTKKADMLGKLDKQVNRLSSLIGDLLDVTKIHTGRMQFNETEFDFNALVEEVIEDVQHTSLKHQIKKELNFKGMIIGDTERLSQVITNLLTNAIKYSPDANQIIIYTQQKDGQVQLCVQDFGIGISAHKKRYGV